MQESQHWFQGHKHPYFLEVISPVTFVEYIPYSSLAIFFKHAFFIPISNLCLCSLTSQNNQRQRSQIVSYRILKWLVKAAWILQVEEWGLFSFTDKDLNSLFLLWIPVYLVCIPQDNRSRKDFTSAWIAIPLLIVLWELRGQSIKLSFLSIFYPNCKLLIT